MRTVQIRNLLKEIGPGKKLARNSTHPHASSKTPGDDPKKVEAQRAGNNSYFDDYKEVQCTMFGDDEVIEVKNAEAENSGLGGNFLTNSVSDSRANNGYFLPSSESHSSEDSEKEKQQQRKLQLKIGSDLEKAWAQIELDDQIKRERKKLQVRGNPSAEVIRKVGRPKKDVPGFVRIGVSFPKRYADFLSRIQLAEVPREKVARPVTRKNEGSAGKMRKIIDHFILYRQREKEQVKSLELRIADLKKTLKTFLDYYKRPEKFELMQEVLGEIKKRVEQIDIHLSLLCMDYQEIKYLIEEDNWRALDLAKTIVTNRQGTKDSEWGLFV